MNNKLLIPLTAAVVVFGVFFSLQRKSSPKSEPSVNQSTQTSEESVHYHAAFHHYKDGVLQDYSGFNYMSVKPCLLEDDHEHTDILDQVHLHDGNGEVVHVHAAGITWKNLFDSIGVKFSSEPDIYVNGEKEQSGLATVIGEYDRAVIVEGSSDSLETMIANVPSVEAIKEAETASELCGV